MRSNSGCLGLVFLLSACQGAPAGRALTGSWGGQHVGLVLSGAGGTLDYDCAAGTIGEPVHPDRGGQFVVHGVHVANTGGPEREDAPRPRVDATYSGRVSGDRLTLSVRTPDAELGPFTLQRNAEPNLMRCL